jgi:hypothetical protein
MRKLDLSWRTPFEVVLAGRPPHEVRNLVRSRGGGWLKRGLHVRIRDDVFLARFNQLSFTPDAVPLLRGRLVDDRGGTKIIGQLQWTTQLGAIAVSATLCVVFAIVCVASIWAATSRDGVVAGIISGLGAAMFGCVAWIEIGGRADQRENESDRLAEELRVRFGR